MPGPAGGMARLHNYARQGKLWETKGLSINKSYILFTEIHGTHSRHYDWELKSEQGLQRRPMETALHKVVQNMEESFIAKVYTLAVCIVISPRMDKQYAKEYMDYLWFTRYINKREREREYHKERHSDVFYYHSYGLPL